MKFIGALSLILWTSLWTPLARAQSQLARDIQVRDNPRFLPHFLTRFSEGFRASTHFAQPEMPEKLKIYWNANMAEPRDFAEEIVPSVRWPRFQWGIQSLQPPRPSTSRVLPVYQWFDIKNPERLAAEWNKAFCFDKERSYIGVTWTGDRSIYEFFIKDGDDRLRLRRYEKQRLVGEYMVKVSAEAMIASREPVGQLFKQTTVGRNSPLLRNPAAAHLQLSVQREFLISPRTYARAADESWERVFFP